MKPSLTKLLIVIVSSILIACSAPIKRVIVSPELHIGSSNAFQQKQIQLRVKDMRTLSHIVQIEQLEHPAQLYPAQQSLEQSVETSLSSALKAHGLTIQPQAKNQVEVIIDSALVKVEQTLLKYGASNEIIFRVVINNSEGTLTKSFKTSGTSKGPLKADIAVLERDFNQQLAKLLTEIVKSEEIQQFLQ